MSTNILLENRLLVSRFSEDEGVKTLALEVWNLRAKDLGVDYGTTLLPLLSHSGNEGRIRLAAARAMAGGMKELPATAAQSIVLLKGLFHSHKPVPAASSGRMLAPIGKKDGKEKEKAASISLVDNDFDTRLAVAEAFRAIGIEFTLVSDQDRLTHVWGPEKLPLDLLDFVLAHGAVDSNSQVRRAKCLHSYI
jgi:hypothetical protein